MKKCWKQQKTVKKSVNLRVNFDKNKKASRIKALREFAMKRLTDFFEEKGWKTGKMGYNENRKRSKYCGWTVPMRDWNPGRVSAFTFRLPVLNRTYERLKQHRSWYSNHASSCWTVPMRDWNVDQAISLGWPLINVEPYLWEIETKQSN